MQVNYQTQLTGTNRCDVLMQYVAWKLNTDFSEHELKCIAVLLMPV